MNSGVTEVAAVGKQSFRKGVCKTLGCSHVGYAEAVFRHCLYPHASLPARVLRSFNPALFASDFELIRLVAEVSDLRDLRKEVESHRYAHRAPGFLRGYLRIRLSGRRLIQLAQQALRA